VRFAYVAWGTNERWGRRGIPGNCGSTGRRAAPASARRRGGRAHRAVRASDTYDRDGAHPARLVRPHRSQDHHRPDQRQGGGGGLRCCPLSPTCIRPADHRSVEDAASLLCLLQPPTRTTPQRGLTDSDPFNPSPLRRGVAGLCLARCRSPIRAVFRRRDLGRLRPLGRSAVGAGADIALNIALPGPPGLRCLRRTGRSSRPSRMRPCRSRSTIRPSRWTRRSSDGAGPAPRSPRAPYLSDLAERERAKAVVRRHADIGPLLTPTTDAAVPALGDIDQTASATARFTPVWRTSLPVRPLVPQRLHGRDACPPRLQIVIPRTTRPFRSASSGPAGRHRLAHRVPANGCLKGFWEGRCFWQRERKEFTTGHRDTETQIHREENQ